MNSARGSKGQNNYLSTETSNREENNNNNNPTKKKGPQQHPSGNDISTDNTQLPGIESPNKKKIANKKVLPVAAAGGGSPQQMKRNASQGNIAKGVSG